MKVEDELKKEKIEMSKLLTAKQEVIEIQRKRIEGMANRLAHTHQQQSQSRTNGVNSTNINNHAIAKQKLNQNILLNKEPLNKNNIHNGNYNNINSSSATNLSNDSHHQQQQQHHHFNSNNNNINNFNHITLNTTHFLRTSEL